VATETPGLDSRSHSMSAIGAGAMVAAASPRLVGRERVQGKKMGMGHLAARAPATMFPGTMSPGTMSRVFSKARAEYPSI
jgi:hypothetical protein